MEEFEVLGNSPGYKFLTFIIVTLIIFICEAKKILFFIVPIFLKFSREDKNKIKKILKKKCLVEKDIEKQEKQNSINLSNRDVWIN